MPRPVKGTHDDTKDLSNRYFQVTTNELPPIIGASRVKAEYRRHILEGYKLSGRSFNHIYFKEVCSSVGQSLKVEGSSPSTLPIIFIFLYYSSKSFHLSVVKHGGAFRNIGGMTLEAVK